MLTHFGNRDYTLISDSGVGCASGSRPIGFLRELDGAGLPERLEDIKRSSPERKPESSPEFLPILFFMLLRRLLPPFSGTGGAVFSPDVGSDFCTNSDPGLFGGSGGGAVLCGGPWASFEASSMNAPGGLV